MNHQRRQRGGRIENLTNAGVSLTVPSDAIACVNGKPASQVVLRNGDTIELGVVKLRFWLEPARQRGLRLVEVFTWVAFAAVTLGEVLLIYELLS